MTELHKTLHNLVGSAGIYGFVNVSAAVTTMLDWIPVLEMREQALTPAEYAELELMLEKLRQEVDSALHTPISAEKAINILIDLPNVNTIPERKGRVFIVDDDPEQARAVEYYLSQAGFDVAWFQAIADVEEAITRARPAAIIMDMMFPQGDLAGAESIVRLNKSTEMNVPVIFLSARKDMKARLAATRAGASHYFTKPVDIGRMIVELNKLTRSVDAASGRILLIDDDPDVTGIIRLHFEQAGYQVECINDPLNVLQAIENFDPDMLLIDLHMPECSGLEVASILRQHDVHFDMPLMFLTSETDPQAKMDAIAVGSDDFFNKQLDSTLLVEAVKSRLERIKEFARVKKATIWSPK